MTSKSISIIVTVASRVILLCICFTISVCGIITSSLEIENQKAENVSLHLYSF